MESLQISAWKIISAGGPFIFPILLCSLCSWIIIIEKILHFSSFKENPETIQKEIFSLVQENKVTDAIRFCDEAKSPVAKVLAAGLLKFGSSKEEIEIALNRASQSEIPQLEKRLGLLLTVANIAPLLGFLGTVTGLAVSFHTIQTQAASLNSITTGDLAAEIWQALIATIAGLTVAIPAYIFYNYFLSRIETLTREIERRSSDLAEYLSQI